MINLKKEFSFRLGSKVEKLFENASMGATFKAVRSTEDERIYDVTGESFAWVDEYTVDEILYYFFNDIWCIVDSPYEEEKVNNLNDYIAIVLRVNRETNKTIIWKVVATSEMAESYVEDSDEEYLFRYEMWKPTGKRVGIND